jgi:hypothetical protein
MKKNTRLEPLYQMDMDLDSDEGGRNTHHAREYTREPEKNTV